MLSSPRSARPFHRVCRSVVALSLLAACSGDDFDTAQVPRITITPVIAASLVVVSWEPAGAQQVQVYKGTVADGNSVNLVWSISGTNTNSLVSGIEYGTNPPTGGATLVAAQPLVRGQPYTVQVSRVDPKDLGGSVSGSRYRYQNTQTFTLAATTTPP
ncbi:MAG: hypothetical protein V4813_10490 [Gemmatimonadota bacterium]